MEFLRLIAKGFKISRYPLEIGRYLMTYHEKGIYWIKFNLKNYKLIILKLKFFFFRFEY